VIFTGAGGLGECVKDEHAWHEPNLRQSSRQKSLNSAFSTVSPRLVRGMPRFSIMTWRPFEMRRSFRVTVAAAALSSVGMALDLTFWRIRMHGPPPWHLVSMAVSASVIAVIFASRKTGKPWIASVLFVLNNLVAEIAIWRASTPLALWAMGWAPFQAEKLGLVTVAVLAPPDPWAGAISIVIFAGSAFAHYASFDPVVRARLLAEPWTTSIYSVFAIFLYAYRLHAVRMARKMAESLSAKRSLEHVSRMLLAVRDFSNTPLQTLYLTTELLKARQGDQAELLDRMDRSLSRLRELNEIMSQYEAQAGWPHGAESLDAAASLQRDVTTTRGPAPGTPGPRTRAH